MKEDVDPIVQAVLERARAAAEPNPAALARGLAGVRARLSSSGEANEPLERSTSAGPRHDRPGAASGAAGRWSALRTPLAFASWGALAAAVGFAFGVRYGREAPERAAAAFVAPAVLQSPLAQGSATPTAATPAALSPVAVSPGAAPPAPLSPVAAKHPAPRATKPLGERREPLLGFREVLDHVRRAERAVRLGEPALALALLGELDMQASDSTLREERLLTRVLALCAQGEVAAAQAAASELAAAAGSIYASRLAKSCTGATNAVRMPPQPDTHEHEDTH